MKTVVTVMETGSVREAHFLQDQDVVFVFVSPGRTARRHRRQGRKAQRRKEYIQYCKAKGKLFFWVCESDLFLRGVTVFCNYIVGTGHL